MNGWILIAVGSLTGISVFSLYVGVHLARGILCNYVYLMPYMLPVAYALGFFLGYAIPQIQKQRVPVELLFEGEEREVVIAAMRGRNQSELSRKLGKVRAHRVVRSLEVRGIIEKEKEGNTYRLRPGKILRRVLGNSFTK